MDSRRSEGIRALFPSFCLPSTFQFSMPLQSNCPLPQIQSHRRRFRTQIIARTAKRTRGGKRVEGGGKWAVHFILPSSFFLLVVPSLLPLIRSYRRRRGRSSSNFWSDLPAKLLWETESLRNEESHSSRER